jgi:hypothetical protein
MYCFIISDSYFRFVLVKMWIEMFVLEQKKNKQSHIYE